MRGPGLLLSLLTITACTANNPYFEVLDGTGPATTGPDSTTSTSEPTTSDASSEPTTTTMTTMTTSSARCGDGNVDPGEACDDGNEEAADDCTNECTKPACGDGVLQEVEECDDGNLADEDLCTGVCKLAACGDGHVNGMESCDDGDDADPKDGCHECVSVACGNGMMDEGEGCDDGDGDDTNGCTNACHVAECGDGIVQVGVDECDDGNEVDGDGCDGCKKIMCGDGVMTAGEACDDGNMEDDDACTSKCVVAMCGDGFVQATVEECEADVPPFSLFEGLCSDDCVIEGCFRTINDVDTNIPGNTWLNACAMDVDKTVVVTLLGADKEVVYLASGIKGNVWKPSNLTFGGVSMPAQEYDVTKHMARVELTHIVPEGDGSDSLMIASQLAHPGEPNCQKSLGDGYGIALFPDVGEPVEPRMLVMGPKGGNTFKPRGMVGFGAATEISYDAGAVMDVCNGEVVGFPGTFILSVLPQ